jgi:hypothetical protein
MAVATAHASPAQAFAEHASAVHVSPAETDGRLATASSSVIAQKLRQHIMQFSSEQGDQESLHFKRPMMRLHPASPQKKGRNEKLDPLPGFRPRVETFFP